MKAVYYFVPDTGIVNEREGTLDLEVVEKRGLSHALGSRCVVPDQTVFYRGLGPVGEGVILFPKPVGCDEIPRCMYDAKSQVWFDCGSFWIGAEVDGSDGIDSNYFRKPSPTTGYVVTDANDDDWTIPIISSPDQGRYCLPTEYTLGFKGEFTRKRRDQDEHLWRLAGTCRDFMVNGGMTEEDVAKAVVAFLGVNYYVSIPEIALLGQLGHKVLQSEFVAATIAAVNDFRLEEDVQKKSVTTGQMSSEPGQPDSSQAIGQAEAQSVS